MASCTPGGQRGTEASAGAHMRASSGAVQQARGACKGSAGGLAARPTTSLPHPTQPLPSPAQLQPLLCPSTSPRHAPALSQPLPPPLPQPSPCSVPAPAPPPAPAHIEEGLLHRRAAANVHLLGSDHLPVVHRLVHVGAAGTGSTAGQDAWASGVRGQLQRSSEEGGGARAGSLPWGWRKTPPPQH
jgi:hypothetical protein